MKILIIIPARGGSKGIPKKNIRFLNGKPLIAHSIETALSSKYEPSVYVSSDDANILSIAKKYGASKIKRNDGISNDNTTLDPVIYNAFQRISKENDISYDYIVTLQPTSPLLTTESLDTAIDLMVKGNQIDTLISAVDDTHLTWSKTEDGFNPNYSTRLNRQQLPPILKETGGFLITRPEWITKESRIGQNIQLYILPKKESIDIDDYDDWNLCEYYLKRKKILFIISGNREIGIGHVYNTLILANEILNHEVKFLILKGSQLAFQQIQYENFEAYYQQNNDIFTDIFQLQPDLVINDFLDTNADYIKTLKSNNIKTVNFEDLGEGAKYSDLVFNAIYPENKIYPNHYYGHSYFCARNEFIDIQNKNINIEVSNVLITFGGVDSNNLTLKTIESINEYCKNKKIEINVIAGFGYNKYDSLIKYSNIKVYKNVNNISEYMLNADIIFTSAGRTTFEIACVGTPAIVLCQNEREKTHFFATKEYGFQNFGLGENVPKQKIEKYFIDLVKDYEMRKYMSKLMLSKDLKIGKKNVIKKIMELLEDE